MMAEKYPHKILIIEDEPALVHTLRDNLTAAGFEHISEAHNGEDGLAMAIHQKPDLILLDIVMPKMDGMTMLKKLREQRTGHKMHVILLTNLAADEKIMDGVTHDEPAFYLVKTEHTIDDVIRRVKETLDIEGSMTATNW